MKIFEPEVRDSSMSGSAIESSGFFEEASKVQEDEAEVMSEDVDDCTDLLSNESG